MEPASHRGVAQLIVVLGGAQGDVCVVGIDGPTLGVQPGITKVPPVTSSTAPQTAAAQELSQETSFLSVMQCAKAGTAGGTKFPGLRDTIMMIGRVCTRTAHRSCWLGAWWEGICLLKQGWC